MTPTTLDRLNLQSPHLCAPYLRTPQLRMLRIRTPRARILGFTLCALTCAAGCDRGPKPPPEAVRSEPTKASSTTQPKPEAPTNLHAGSPPNTPAPSSSGPERTKVDPKQPLLAGVTWKAPAPLEWSEPKKPMRQAEYTVAGAGKAEAATLTVHHFPGMGGTVQENVDRWVGQFEAPGGAPKTAKRTKANKGPNVVKRTIRGLPVTTVDMRGAYGGMRIPGRPAAPPKPDQRLLGAIVEAPQGLVFFKLTGPAATVGGAADAFEELVSSFAPAGS